MTPCKKRRRDDLDFVYSANAAIQPPLCVGGIAKPVVSAPDHHFYTSLARQQNHEINPPMHLRNIPPEKIFDHGSSHHHHQSAHMRKILTLPSKRQRVLESEDRGQGEDGSTRRRRTQSPSQHETSRLQETSANSRSTTPFRTTTTSAVLMSRCHVCFRKPAKKSDLDSFADCQGCGQRTCYVCIRECIGWQADGNVTLSGGDSDTGLSESPLASDASFTMVDAGEPVGLDMDQDDRPDHSQTSSQTDARGLHRPQESNGWARGGHRQTICSQCCIERGQDGDVVCLGCLALTG